MGEDELTLQKAIEDFIIDRELNNNTAKTIRTYEQRLRYFTPWLESAHSVVLVVDLQLVHLRGWIGYLQKTPTYRGKKLSDDSIHSYGQSLLAFCHWLEREELIEKPITTRFRLPRVEGKFIPTFTSDDVQKLLWRAPAAARPEARAATTGENDSVRCQFFHRPALPASVEDRLCNFIFRTTLTTKFCFQRFQIRNIGSKELCCFQRT